ncbi:hypothetical protein JCM24511_08044 [Saitozyma sp. JCM 24511]|nr:hypothetical protein JCM24511_08044 [Saitozyma sp. JCM 24511]
MESSRPRITRSPDIYADALDIGGASNRSSPSRPSLPLPSAQIAQLALVFSQHPAASAPSSPHQPTTALYEPPLSAGRAAHRRAPLPYNPYTHHPPSLPPPPLSPELRTVALPLLTPGRSSDEYSRPSSEARRISISGSEVSEVVSALLEQVSASSGRPERDRLSGSTAVDEDTNEDKGKDQIADVEVVLDGEADDVEEAKVNRKVADLEISNASLLAINRSLEATKAKQRSEILKLRRALRESLHGITPSFALGPTSTSTSLHSALSFLSPAAEPYADDLDGYFSDEAMADPQLEARWDKITDTLGHMLRRGEEAVARGREDVKPEGAKVLGWMDMDGLEDGSGSAAGTGTGAVGTPDRGETASPVV